MMEPNTPEHDAVLNKCLKKLEAMLRKNVEASCEIDIPDSPQARASLFDLLTKHGLKHNLLTGAYEMVEKGKIVHRVMIDMEQEEHEHCH